MEIKTKRLTLRPIRIGDENEIHEYAGDREITMMFWRPNDTFTSGEYTCMITRDEWENLK